MSDQEDKDQSERLLSPDEQEDAKKQAQEVWGSIKFLFAGLVVAAVFIVGLVAYWLFQSFGLVGLLGGGVVLGVAVVLLVWHLLSY